jgi:predicted PurR-regulated permease PerM
MMRVVEGRVLLGLTVLVTAVLVWVLRPFFGAILWGAILTMLFAPLHTRLQLSLGWRPTWSAMATTFTVFVVVILPLLVITSSLLQEATTLYAMVNTGDIDFGETFKRVADGLPIWVRQLLEASGLANLNAVQQKITYLFREGSQALAVQLLGLGQSTVHLVISFFVMMYLLFFLLRDGEKLFVRIKRSIALPVHQQDELFEKFVQVVRATVKGDLLVAVLQGALGGLAFWALDIRAPLVWGVLMAVVSLLPAVGAAIVWVPVAIYLLASGSFWQGIALIAFGTLVIGLVDNILRPILVGQDTKMPEYLVLFSTLGGLEVFGPNGFVLGPVIAAMFMAVWDISAKSTAHKG